MHSRHRPAVYAILAVLVGVLVLSILMLMVRTWSVTDQIREQQKTNTTTNNQTAATLKAVQDCTQPSGECFQRGQKRTASAVGDINRVVILASACSVGLDPKLTVTERQTLIQTCVIERLAAKP